MINFKRPIAVLCLSLVGITACHTEPDFSAFVEVELPEDPVIREQLVYVDANAVPVVFAVAETEPVKSVDDAADDPAIWVHPKDPSKSLILGTDKQSGIGVYTLSGHQVQFLELGYPNNIDLRQDVSVTGWSGDLAVASNRDGDKISLLSVSELGVNSLASFPSSLVEPYGICMGRVSDKIVIFVTYKDGHVIAHHVAQMAQGEVNAPVIGRLKLESQLEGCVVNDQASSIYIGEEAKGLWQAELEWRGSELIFKGINLIDHIVSDTGITADVEGVSRYQNDSVDYLIVSSQGNDSYAVYQTNSGDFLGRFRIARSESVDGAQETDGLDVTASGLGERFPKGVLVVQDGFNAPANTPQNFKIVDWRDVEKVLGL